MEFKRKFNMEDSPSTPASSKYSSMRLCSTKQHQVCISPPANHPSRLRFKRSSSKEPSVLQLNFDPPPPHLHHLASKLFPNLLRPPLHHQNQIPGGGDISKSNLKMFIQAHVILSIHVFHWGPSAKDIFTNKLL
ncbi:hypothetical protein AMECASPLE_018773 [Ameca splendens]|uniref:Uncharacterized protein n=1 Tax=Ameca splendens TaxID=208324 RepID=A0ABV0Y2P8_9TELE